MALQFTDTEFTREGYTLSGLTEVFCELGSFFPPDSLMVRTELKVWKDNTKTLPLLKGVDLLSDNWTLDPISLGKPYFQINAEDVHDLMITALETANPAWIGKITKIDPTAV